MEREVFKQDSMTLANFSSPECVFSPEIGIYI